MEENLKQQHTSVVKIVLFGPENNDKSKLSSRLATHFDSEWVADYAKEFLQKTLGKTQEFHEPEDLLPIAIGQTKLENHKLLTANNYLFCDACLLNTKVFSEQFYNFCDPAIDKACKKHKYDLFFLVDNDNSLKKEDVLNSSDQAQITFAVFKQVLIENNKPFITLKGDENTKFDTAVSIINSLEKAKKMGFSSHDFVQIHKKGINIETIQEHLDVFRIGISKATLIRPATNNDGVVKLSDDDFYAFSKFFDQKKDSLSLKKFVPASGAATRMFKFLNEFLNEFDVDNESMNAYINRKGASELAVFLAGMEKLPFFKAVDKKLKENNADFNSWESSKKNYHFIKLLLASNGFDYSGKPKAILPFHKYHSHITTPIEEHLNEAVNYANSNGLSKIHFTISEIHQQQFEKIIDKVKENIEKQSNVELKVQFSIQNPATDTIAVDFSNNPFRNDNGKLVFRPGGHGALIDNLNNLDAEIIFIKNIDNVIQNQIETIALYKKGLAGLLIDLQLKIFQYLNQIQENSIQQEDLEDVMSFIQNKLNIAIINDFVKYTFEYKLVYIKEVLNRPIRVCGMVKNEGEAGGGPFWVRDNKGNASLQIIETSQIDLHNPAQKQILSNATHFNPVDLVCGIKDYKGNKFNLYEFIDATAGFIVEKNTNGRDLKAYELPGLWNGAMAKWITLFVEVPIATFNPVKTVNDLFKPAHQPQK